METGRDGRVECRRCKCLGLQEQDPWRRVKSKQTTRKDVRMRSNQSEVEDIETEAANGRAE